MAKTLSHQLEGWMPQLVTIEAVIRDLADLELIKASQASPYQAQIDHHEHVRNHLVSLYQSAFDSSIDDLSREAHVMFRKRKLENENGIAALFLILSDDLDSNFAHAVGGVAQKAYTYAEQAMGDAFWGNLAERGEEFGKMRAKDLTGVSDEVIDRLQKAVLVGLANKESPLALSRRLDEAIRDSKGIEGSRMAETEATITLGTAVDSIMSATGMTHKRWLSKRDDRVRHSHEECDAQGWVPIGKTFVNGLKYPGQADAPLEEIIGCRCVLIGEKRK